MPLRDGAEVEDAPQKKVSRTEENRVPNANDGFAVHEGSKGTGKNNPLNDHDLRYARILETITKSALTTREEIVSSGKFITDQINQADQKLTDQINQTDQKLTDQINQADQKLAERIDHSQKLTAIQVDKLTNDVSKLQIAFDQGIKNCNDRIQQQEVKLDDFKAQFKRKLELLQKNTTEARLGSPSGLTRATSAPSLGAPVHRAHQRERHHRTHQSMGSRRQVTRGRKHQ